MERLGPCDTYGPAYYYYYSFAGIYSLSTVCGVRSKNIR